MKKNQTVQGTFSKLFGKKHSNPPSTSLYATNPPWIFTQEAPEEGIRDFGKRARGGGPRAGRRPARREGREARLGAEGRNTLQPVDGPDRRCREGEAARPGCPGKGLAGQRCREGGDACLSRRTLAPLPR